VAPRPLRLSDPGGGVASREARPAAAASGQEARPSLAQTLRTLSDDEEYAAGMLLQIDEMAKQINLQKKPCDFYKFVESQILASHLKSYYFAIL